MIEKMEDAIKGITGFLQNFTDIAVLGMSGGADSTLVAILCSLALGKENVFPIYMPDRWGKSLSNDLAPRIADHLGLKIEKYSVKDIADSLIQRTVAFQYHVGKDKLIEGNTKARLRMIMLYIRANTLSLMTGKRVRVIGTGNLDELTLGYFTKYGDGGVDCLPIGKLHKTEVYQMLDYFCRKGLITKDMIDRVPSAGLWDGQTDEGELGFSYKAIEKMLEGEIMEASVAERINKNKHKSKMPTVVNIRQFCKKGESK